LFGEIYHGVGEDTNNDDVVLIEPTLLTTWNQLVARNAQRQKIIFYLPPVDGKSPLLSPANFLKVMDICHPIKLAVAEEEASESSGEEEETKEDPGGKKDPKQKPAKRSKNQEEASESSGDKSKSKSCCFLNNSGDNNGGDKSSGEEEETKEDPGGKKDPDKENKEYLAKMEAFDQKPCNHHEGKIWEEERHLVDCWSVILINNPRLEKLDQSITGERSGARPDRHYEAAVPNCLARLFAAAGYGFKKGFIKGDTLDSLGREQGNEEVDCLFIRPLCHKWLQSLPASSKPMDIDTLMMVDLGGTEQRLIGKLKKSGYWSSQCMHEKSRVGNFDSATSTPTKKEDKLDVTNKTDIQGIEWVFARFMCHYSKKFFDAVKGMKHTLNEKSDANLLPEQRNLFNVHWSINNNMTIERAGYKESDVA
jgi:hypothetical protein